MKKLLEKLSEEKQAYLETADEFERRLDEILKRNKINNILNGIILCKALLNAYKNMLLINIQMDSSLEINLEIHGNY